jgi:hypothetical protein
MATTPEGKIKNWVKKELLKKYPRAWIYNAPGGRFGRKGVPDLLCCIDGLFVAIEVKTDKGSVSPTQKHELGLLVKSSAIAAVIKGKDIDKLNRIFRTIDSKAFEV